MSKTLNLVDLLLFRGRNLQRHGQYHRAASVFTQLAGLRDLPSDVAEEAHARLAEIHLETGEPGQARRHLAAAIARQPDCAHYHYLFAAAVEEDPRSTGKRAGEHYRRCLALEDAHPDYWCDYALHALRHGQTRLALTSLRRAAECAADDPEMLGRIADGFRQASKPAEAKALLRAALFRNPRDRRFRGLWDRHQFDLLHAAQGDARPPAPASKDEPIILPFRRPRRPRQSVNGKTIRTDGPARLKGPTILSLRVARKKDA